MFYGTTSPFPSGVEHLGTDTRTSDNLLQSNSKDDGNVGYGAGRREGDQAEPPKPRNKQLLLVNWCSEIGLKTWRSAC